MQHFSTCLKYEHFFQFYQLNMLIDEKKLVVEMIIAFDILTQNFFTP